MKTLEEIEQFARERYIPVMLDDTKELLYNTVKARSPKRILEIGTAIGYSGIVMLSACGATLNTVEMDERNVAIARENFALFNLLDRVNLFVGDAREMIGYLSGSYAFIFLDGPKGQYKAFLPFLTDLLEVNGVLFCDNALYKGLVEHIPDNPRHKHITVARNMRAFLEEIMSSERYSTTLYHTGDGVTVSVKLF